MFSAAAVPERSIAEMDEDVLAAASGVMKPKPRSLLKNFSVPFWRGPRLRGLHRQATAAAAEIPPSSTAAAITATAAAFATPPPRYPHHRRRHRHDSCHRPRRRCDNLAAATAAATTRTAAAVTVAAATNPPHRRCGPTTAARELLTPCALSQCQIRAARRVSALVAVPLSRRSPNPSSSPPFSLIPKPPAKSRNSLSRPQTKERWCG